MSGGLSRYFRLAEEHNYDLETGLPGLRSFYDPEMNIELSTFNFTNPASFRDSWKLLQEAGSHPVKYSFEYENKAVLSRYSCCIESTIADTAKSVLAYEMNPVLNSPLDITDDLIRRIIDNNLETLTINYEFCEFEMSHVEFISTGFLEICECNPFRIANSMDTLKRINFEVILGRKVHSLKHAFSSFKELEFVNLRDTSRITDMSSMFEGASSFNQPIRQLGYFQCYRHERNVL